MKKICVALVASVGVVVPQLLMGSAAASRSDQFVTVWCEAPDGSTAPYEAVDLRAVEVGNKDDQVVNYGSHHTDWNCQIGPFT